MTASGFRFIDLPTSAERLGITRTQLLQWVDEGRIKPFSSKGQTSVFRAGDIDKLVAEISAAQAAAEPKAVAPPESSDEQASAGPVSRVRRRDPVKLIGTRLSQDSRWAEITDADISTWLDATEPIQLERVQRVAGIAIERLRKVLAGIDQKGG